MPVAEFKKSTPEQVFNRFKVFRYLGLHLASRKMYRESVQFYRLAEDFARGPHQEWAVAVERAKVHCALGELEQARSHVEKALHVSPGNVSTQLALAKQLFAEDRIEDSLIVSHVGFRRRNLFGHLVRAATGTIENCVGINAGPMMTMSRLGPTIVKMKRRELGIVPRHVNLPPLEKKKREALFEAKLKCYIEKLLGPIAREKEFLQDCSKNSMLFKGSQATAETLQEIINNGIKKVGTKQDSLWQRMPLYTQEEMTAKPSESILLERKDAAYTKVAVGNNEAVRQLDAITECLSKGERVPAYNKCLNLWRYLAARTTTHLPNKKALCEALYEALGSLYLSSKTLISDLSDEENTARIIYLLGIFRPYTVRMELYKSSFHAPFYETKGFIEEMIKYMTNATDSLEIAVIAHELACVYSHLQNKSKTRLYARICVFESKRAGHLIWYLNGLFMLCRSELQEANIKDARVTLTAARDMSKLFSFKDAYHFSVNALRAIRKETEMSLRGGASIAIREKQLLDLMATPELKFMCSKQLAYTNSLPPALRMSVLPGVKPKRSKEGATEDARQDDEPSLERQLKEEQNIQYRIKQRFTLTSPDTIPAPATSQIDLTHLILK